MRTSEKISNIIKASIEKAQKNNELPEFKIDEIMVEKPKNKQFGNWTSNIALTISKKAKLNPVEIAGIITKNISKKDLIDNIDVLHPGFLNFKLSSNFRSEVIKAVLSNENKYGSSEYGKGEKVQVEFVSVNPTGPVHVGHARGAIVGSSIAKILSFSGYKVTKEYYVNDAGTQIDLFADSIKSKIYEKLGKKIPFPEGGYQGENINEISEKIIKILNLNKENIIKKQDEEIRKISLEITMKKIKKDLEDIGITYDNWFFESSLFQNNTINDVLEILEKKNLVYESEGAKWFKSSNYFTENDVVINRSNDDGHTYFFSDMAYHYDKFKIRDFNKVINIFGADHHSHVDRLKSAVEAMDINSNKLVILLTQIVHFKNENKIQKFSKRSGNIYTIRDLLEVVGKDVCRFNFLNRSLESQQEFDLDLATKESSENPIYYVQYAYARLCSIIDSSKEIEGKENFELLDSEFEKDLIDDLDLFPEVILNSAQKLQTHNITQYSIDLARNLQKFYENCRVISEDTELSKARVKLILACKIVLKNTLEIMGINAPERM